MYTWAATVCERVGNNFEIHAVFNPAPAHPIVARKPEPPAPTTTTSYSWSIIVYCPAEPGDFLFVFYFIVFYGHYIINKYNISILWWLNEIFDSVIAIY